MDSNEAKMITTLGIWGAVASILVFGGVFKLTGDGLAFVIMIVVPSVLAGCAAAATAAVWGRSSSSADAKARAAAPSVDVR